MNTALKLEPAPIRLERIACPRCGSFKSSTIFSAHDYLYGLAGTFYAASCDDCDLWFQNPRPVADDIPLLYPNTYAPHAEIRAQRNGPIRPAGWLPSGWRGWNHGYLTKCLKYHHRSG